VNANHVSYCDAVFEEESVAILINEFLFEYASCEPSRGHKDQRWVSTILIQSQLHFWPVNYATVFHLHRHF